MKASINQAKPKALELRKIGYSYRQIMAEVKVAKSTLSYWLRHVDLTPEQVKTLAEKRINARLKALSVVRKKRLNLIESLLSEGIKEINMLSRRELLLIGTALYWAEGSKQRPKSISQPVDLSNSDPLLLKVFLNWLDTCCGIDRKGLRFELSVHESAGIKDLEGLRNWWKVSLNLESDVVIHTYQKRHNFGKIRRQSKDDYHGQFRIKVIKSTNLNRKIDGWIAGIVDNFNHAGSSNGRTTDFGSVNSRSDS